MMEFFYENQDFFQLKELEKGCPKEKCITSLVDDGIVDTENIGTSVYFWAFPSKASKSRKRKLDDVVGANLQDSAAKRQQVETQLGSVKIRKDATEERERVLSSLREKERDVRELEADMMKYRECDPEVMEQMEEEVETSGDAANRWTDNVFSITAWVKRKFSFNE